MKIILAADIFPPDIGGPATYSKNLATELVKNKNDIQVICYGDKTTLVNEHNKYSLSLRGGTTKQFRGFQVIKINRDKLLILRYFHYFFHLLTMAKSADLIYAMGPVSAGLPTMLVAKILRKKYIVKVVGDYAWEQARGRFGVRDNINKFQKKKYSWRVEIFRRVQKMVVKNALKIIVPSYYLQKIVEGWGGNKNNIKVIYNAVDFHFINLLNKKVVQEKIFTSLSIISEQAGIYKTVLSIGRLVPWKGFVMLIKIWPKILKKEPDLKLIIIGDGPEKENLKNLIKKENLEKNIFLVGRIDHKDLPIYFSVSDIFVLNSGYEGLSHVLIESIVSRVPVIASDRGGNSEIIKNKENGLLVEYNNQKKWEQAILQLLNNQKLKEKFIKNSLKSLDKFKYTTMINNTVKFLKSII